MVALAAATAVTVSRAAEFPLWEAGVGVAVLNFPDYRGSDQRHTLVLPFPYVVYRGDLMKADRESVRGQFYKDDRLDLHLSANGSIPVDSTDNSARRGMPNLDPTLEIGPNLTVTLLRTDTTHLNLRFPVRAVIATNLSHARDEGWVFQPQLNVDFYDIIPGPGWNLGLAAGPLYGNSRYHNYFYGVAPEFAIPQRPAYDAHGGYGGMQFVASLSKRYASYWVGGFVRADTLSGAVFEDSPLVRQKEAYAAGFAIAWVFGQSEKRVDSVE
jgi:outer membrane scaffolding protein for murein synthesis (MipA/OmpV family)